MSEKSKIVEGNLDADEMHQVVRILSDDQIYLLQQDQIAESLLRSRFDELRLAVLRPLNRWQGLIFPDPVAREPYRRSLDPLLIWLDRLEKNKGLELSEDSGRNNCTPPHEVDVTLRRRNQQEPGVDVSRQAALPAQGDAPQLKPRSAENQSADSIPQLKSRPVENVAQGEGNVTSTSPNRQTTPVSSKQYLLRIVSSSNYPRMQGNRFSQSVEQAECAVISPSGKYHSIAQSHESGSDRVHSSVVDGRLNEQQLTALGGIFEAPEFSKLSFHELQDLAFVPMTLRNGFFFWISFWRDGKAYEYELARPFQSRQDSATEKTQQAEWQSLAPLLTWLKQNLNLSKAPPARNPANSLCTEVP